MTAFATTPEALLDDMTVGEMASGLTCGNISVGKLNWLFKAALANADDQDTYVIAWSAYNAATNVATFTMSDGTTLDVDFTTLVNDAVATALAQVISGLPALLTESEAAAQYRHIDAPMIVPFHADAGATLTLNAQAAAAQLLGNTSRAIIRADLTRYRQVRICGRLLGPSGAVTSPRLRGVYQTAYDGNVFSFGNLGGATVVAIGLDGPNGYRDSAWVDLTPAAKADVYLSIIQEFGDGAASPGIGALSLQFR